jgi:hypothetical protein
MAQEEIKKQAAFLRSTVDNPTYLGDSSPTPGIHYEGYVCAR